MRSRLHLSMQIVALALGLAGCRGSAGVYAQSSLGSGSELPATILIIRHAEKQADGQSGLSAEGKVRAQLLLKAFVPQGTRGDLPTPQFIFAAAVSPHSNRSALTVGPLAEALHLEINQDFKDHKYAALAAELSSGRYAGKVVLVSWHHGKIPELATALGATPPYDPWPEGQYDHIWRIDYINGRATLRDIPYVLAPGR